jgi:hypothetical protein
VRPGLACTLPGLAWPPLSSRTVRNELSCSALPCPPSRGTTTTSITTDRQTAEMMRMKVVGRSCSLAPPSLPPSLPPVLKVSPRTEEECLPPGLPPGLPPVGVAGWLAGSSGWLLYSIVRLSVCLSTRRDETRRDESSDWSRPSSPQAPRRAYRIIIVCLRKTKYWAMPPKPNNGTIGIYASNPYFGLVVIETIFHTFLKLSTLSLL